MVASILSFGQRQSEPIRPQTSATPILDLLEPLPKPADQIITGRFAFPFLTFVGLIVMTENLSFLIVPFSFLVIAFLDVAIHEFGHLIAGWCVGLSFKGVDFGPISIKRIRGKWGFRLRVRTHDGEAHMSLRQIRRMRRQLVIFALGGPLTSYVFGISVLVLGEMHRARDSNGLTTLLEFLGFFCFLTGVLSTIPFRTSRGGNDAFILRQLLCSKQGATQMIAAYALSFAMSTEPIIPEYHQRWWRLASASPHPTHNLYYQDWNSYRAAEDSAVAAECLERLLKGSSSLDEELRNHLVAEAAYFTAWQRGSIAQSRIWFQLIPHPEWLDPLARWRVEIAVCTAEKRFDEALAKCESGIAFLRDNRKGPLSRKSQAEWVSWRYQIEERKLSEFAALAPVGG